MEEEDRKQDDAYFSSFLDEEDDEMDMANLEETFDYTADKFQSRNLLSIEEEGDEGYCTEGNKDCRDAKPIVGEGMDKDIDGQCPSDSVECKDPIKKRFNENLADVHEQDFAQQEVKHHKKEPLEIDLTRPQKGDSEVVLQCRQLLSRASVLKGDLMSEETLAQLARLAPEEKASQVAHLLTRVGESR